MQISTRVGVAFLPATGLTGASPHMAPLECSSQGFRLDPVRAAWLKSSSMLEVLVVGRSVRRCWVVISGTNQLRMSVTQEVGCTAGRMRPEHGSPPSGLEGSVPGSNYDRLRGSAVCGAFPEDRLGHPAIHAGDGGLGVRETVVDGEHRWWLRKSALP